jgi:hypothetical protein
MYPSLLAVIFTNLEESGLAGIGTGLAPPLVPGMLLFIKETDLAEEPMPTGVIISLGGGVFGLGGRSETLTSMGAMREPGGWSWTTKPARAITQSGSIQDRSQTASRWDLNICTRVLL